MTTTIAAPLAIRKGFNFSVVRADGWYQAGDVLHVTRVENIHGIGERAVMSQVSAGRIVGESLFSFAAVTANIITGKWSVCQVRHYLVGQDVQRVLYESTGDFADAAICGNGAPAAHLNTTRLIQDVTCIHCIKKVNRYHAKA